MGGFTNPVFGGDTLIRPAVRSPNYRPNVSGWSINKDGSVEFNNATIRNGITVGSTDLHYNGTPQAGNLVASISSAAGVDAYGNHYLSGVCVYDPVNGIFAQLDSGIQRFGIITAGVPDTTNAAALNVDAAAGVLDILSSVDAAGGFPNRALLEVIAGAANVTAPGGAEPYLNVQDPAQQSVVSMYLSGALVKSSVGGTPETWQTPSPYSTGWAGTTTFGTLSGGLGTLRYRKDAQDQLHLCGTFVASTGAGSTVFNLPAAYRPKTNGPIPIAWISSGGVAGNAWAYVSVAGNLNLNSQLGSAATVGTAYTVNGKIPLGNLP